MSKRNHILNKRLNELLNVLKKDYKQIASEVDDVEQRTLYSYVIDDRVPNVDIIIRICNHYKVNFNWFMAGTGEMFINHKPKSNNDFYAITHYHYKLSAGKGCKICTELTEKDPIKFDKEFIENIVKSKPENLFIVCICGESMSPTINEGDYVLVDKTKKEPSLNGIFALRVWNDVYAKRMSIFEDKIKLYGDNKTIEPVFVTEFENDQVEILGRIVWHSRII